MYCVSFTYVCYWQFWSLKMTNAVEFGTVAYIIVNYNNYSWKPVLDISTCFSSFWWNLLYLEGTSLC